MRAWPTAGLHSRAGVGMVLFASTSTVIHLVYRCNITVCVLSPMATKVHVWAGY